MSGNPSFPLDFEDSVYNLKWGEKRHLYEGCVRLVPGR